MESTTHDEDMTDVNDVRSSNQVRKVDSQMLGLRLENPLPTRLKSRSVASQLGLKKNSLIDLSYCISISCSIITDSSALVNRVFLRFPKLISRPLLRGSSSNAASSTTSTKS